MLSSHLGTAFVVLFGFLFLWTYSQPPGGAFSSCCSGTTHECNHEAVDVRFVPEDCEYYANVTGISCHVRKHFMRQVTERSIEVAGTPCPFNPFFAIVVNHTGPNIEDGIILCEGQNVATANGPMWHAEMHAMNICDALINSDDGAGQAKNPLVWQKLSVYTNGESCTMCYGMERFHRLGESIFGLSINRLNELGWSQITVTSQQIQQRSNTCAFGNGSTTSYQTRVIQNILPNTIAPLFAWQFNATAPCPDGCVRSAGTCVVSM